VSPADCSSQARAISSSAALLEASEFGAGGALAEGVIEVGAAAGEIAGGGEPDQQGLDDGVGLREATLAVEPRGQRPRVGLEDGDAAGPQRAHVGDHRGVLPHAAVHGGRHQHGAARREEERAEKVVGEPARRLGERVGGGRRDHEGIGALGQRDAQPARVAAERLRGPVLEQVLAIEV